MTDRRKVFISYAHADGEFVDRLYTCLGEHGYEPWLDRYSLTAGDDYRQEILRGIHNCDYFLLVVSRNSVGRDGVLAGELREGLKIWSERLDTGYLIPIRIDETPMPAELERLQAVIDIEGKEPEKVVLALKSRATRAHRTFQRRHVLAAVVLFAAIAAFLVYKGWQRNIDTQDYEIYVHRRAGAPKGPTASVTQVGVTLWRVDGQKQGARCSDLQFTRMAVESPLSWGDHVRLTVEPSQRGYLYVVNQTVWDHESDAQSNLIYPSAVMTANVAPVQPGHIVEVPATLADDACPTFQLINDGPGHKGELVWVIFARDPILALAPGSDAARPIDASVVRDVRAAAILPDRHSTSDSGIGQQRSQAERDAVRPGGARSLSYFDPRPQSVYTSMQQQKPFLVEIMLKPVR